MKLIKAISLILAVYSITLGFDFNQYKPGNLDSLLTCPEPGSSAEIFAPQKLQFQVALAEYGSECQSGFLKKSLVIAGAPQEAIDKLQITCIKVKTEKGKTATLFIQSQVAKYLPEEIKIGEKIEIYGDYVYLGKNGPGILISEFQKIK